jgi:two-component system sensor histidine kinase LytS
METGRSSYLKGSKDIGCWDDTCPLQSAVIVPLRKGKEILGTLALYGDRNILLYDVDFQMARGLARLFSTQLELEDIQVQTHMLARAEIRRLQSQINPHFLFNSLNTIASFCRTDMAKARELLRELSRYLRNNLRGHKELVSVGQEMDHVNSYLAIERARFGERIKVSTDMQPGSEQWQIPPLTIQPLVENAIRHGLKNLESGGEVHIATQAQNGELRITVTDNGQGMTPEIINKVLDENCPSDQGNGVGLRNVEQRLKQLYGKKYGLSIVSQKFQGTTITLRIPRSSYLL